MFFYKKKRKKKKWYFKAVTLVLVSKRNVIKSLFPRRPTFFFDLYFITGQNKFFYLSKLRNESFVISAFEAS